MYRSVIGIDPGKRTGAAVFWQNDLWSAFYFDRSKAFDELPIVPFLPVIIIIEKPWIYPLGLGKGDPNDLIDLAIFAGEIAGWYRARLAGVEIVFVAPRTWKGTVPKAIHNERVLAALTADERKILPKHARAKGFDHNMIDAVGLALWQLERKGQR